MKKENGFSLIETLIALVIAGIISIAVFSVFGNFFQQGSSLSALDQRIGNAAQVQVIADHFLTKADYDGQATAVTLSEPTIQNKNGVPNVGLAIQWQPVLASTESAPVVCEGVLVDKSIPEGNGITTQGLEWSAMEIEGSATANPCGTGTAFFPTNNHWAFTLTNQENCPNPKTNPNAILLTSNYAYGSQGTDTTQVISICLPNLPN